MDKPRSNDVFLSHRLERTYALPQARYKFPLSELVGKVVTSQPEQLDELLTIIEGNSSTEPHYNQILDAYMSGDISDVDTYEQIVRDWEKALQDEARAQFPNSHRALAEIILNAMDSQVRKDLATSTRRSWDEPPQLEAIDVHIEGNRFYVRDHGEGMDLQTIITKLLTPKITGNENAQGRVIGRFGVGFYSLLNFLKERHDTIVIKTHDGKQGHIVRISRYIGPEKQQSGRFAVIIEPMSESEQDTFGQGTELFLRSNSLDNSAAKEVITDTLKYKKRMDIRLNNEVINPPSSLQSFSFDFYPNEDFSEENKQSPELLYSENITHHCTVEVLVGGVKVETFSVSGLPVPEKLVINLPPDAEMPKSRDQVILDKITSGALAGIIIRFFSSAESKDNSNVTYAIANALTTVCDDLQKRNTSHYENDNIFKKLLTWVNIYTSKLEPKPTLIPAGQNTELLQIPNMFILDSQLLREQRELHGLSPLPGFQGRRKLYKAAINSQDRVFVVAGRDVLFISDEFNVDDPEVALSLNHLFDLYDKSVISDDHKIKSSFEVKVTSIDQTQSTSRSSDNMSGNLSRVDDSPPKVEQDDVEKGVKEFIENYLLGDAVRDRKKMIYDQKNITDEQFKPKLNEDELFEIYVPHSPEEIQKAWILEKISHELRNKGYYTAFSSNVRFSGKHEFWQEILGRPIVKQAHELLNKRLAESEYVNLFLTSLPDNVREYMQEKFKDVKSLIVCVVELKKYLELHYKEENSDEYRDLVEFYFIWKGVQEVLPTSDSYFDTSLLQELCVGGKYQDFLAKKRHPYTIDEPVGPYLDYMFEFHHSMSVEQRREFMDWYVDARERIENLNQQYEVLVDVGDRGYKDNALFIIDKDVDRFGLFHAGVRTEADWKVVEKNIQMLHQYMVEENCANLFIGIHNSGERYHQYKVAILAEPNLTREKIDFIVKATSTITDSNLAVQSRYKLLEVIPDHTGNYQALSEFIIADETEHAQNRFSSTNKAISSSSVHIEMRALQNKVNVSYDLIFANFAEQFAGINIEYQRGYLILVSGLAADRLSFDSSIDEQKQVFAEIHYKVSAVMNELLKLPPDQCLKTIRELVETHSDENLIQNLRFYAESALSAFDTIRPLASYLLNKEPQFAVNEEAQDFFRDTFDERSFLGSELIAKYFSKGKVESGNKALPPMAEKLGKRRIEHAVNFQDSGKFIWLRELIQNAFNATRERGVDPQMKVWDSYTPDRQYRVTVEDPVGMSLNQVIDNLLIPQRSGWNEQIEDKVEDVWGEFGHGFFTVFKEADIVRIKTSQGDGKVVLLEVRPIREKNKVVDLDCKLAIKDEQYKGTQVQWSKETTMPDIQSHHIQTALKEHAETISKDKLQIIWRNEVINKEQSILGGYGIKDEAEAVLDSKSEVLSEEDLGPVRILLTPGQQKVTRNGLFVKKLSDEYWAMMPKLCGRILKEVGVSLDLSSKIQLIDSQSEIAQKDVVLPRIKKPIANASIEATFQCLIENLIPLHELPYDLFTEALTYAATASPEIVIDAVAIQQGRTINLEPYENSEEKMLQLILHIPWIKLQDGNKISLIALLVRSEEQPELLELLPEKIAAEIRNQRQLKELNKEAAKYHAEQKGFSNAKEAYLQELAGIPEAKIYRGMLYFIKILMKYSGVKDYEDIRLALHNRTTSPSYADYEYSTKTMRWNLIALERVMPIFYKFSRGEIITKEEFSFLFEDVFDTAIHELTHHVRQDKQTLTHNPDFYKVQVELFEKLLKHLNLDRLKENLRDFASDTAYISPSQMSQILRV